MPGMLLVASAIDVQIIKLYGDDTSFLPNECVQYSLVGRPIVTRQTGQLVQGSLRWEQVDKPR